MTRRLATIFLALGLLLGLASAAFAQDAAEGEVRIEEADVRRHPTVNLTVSVPAAISNSQLDSSAFTVTEDGVERVVVAQALPADDLQVVLVLDASTSMRGQPLTAAKEAATGFLGVLPDSVDVAVVSFASTTQVLSEFTTDRAASAAAISSIVVAGETALYDGVVEGAALFDTSVPSRRAMVLLSDGGDTISQAPMGDAIADLVLSDVSFYAVELQSPENDGAAIAQIATATEGSVVPAEDPEALTGVFEEIASQIANRYVLTYASESFDTVEIGVTVEAAGVTSSTANEIQLPAEPVTPVKATPEPASPAPVEPEAPPVDPMALRDGDVVSLAWYQTNRALILGAGAVFLAIAGLVVFAGLNRRKREVRYGGAFAVAEVMKAGKSTALKSIAQGATSFAERSLEGDKARGINAALERAGVAMRPGEFIVMAASVGLGALAIGFVFGGLLAGLGAALVVLFIFRWRLSAKARKRARVFGEQLPDALQLMAGSLRAGFGFMQAVNTVGTEVAAPCGDEFRRVRIETQLGKDVDEALNEMADRVHSEDFKWIVEAIEIHREVGGDLAEILDTVTSTIRERNGIRRRIQALSAEGKISGVVLGGLPFALAVVIMFLNPTYLMELLDSTMGIAMIVGGLVAMVIGIVWMRRITNLKF
jgi:tight adherence protein B